MVIKDISMPAMGKSFTHLSRAPIVEAVIDIRARSEKEWGEETVKAAFKKELPDYPKGEEQRALLAEFIAGSKQTPQATTKDLGLNGYLFRSEDNLQVAQFQKEGYVFSRLKPYQDWESFVKEARRLWEIHRKILAPSDVLRLGVRFINRIAVPPAGDLDDILTDAPKPPCRFEWAFNSFFHRDVFSVPGEPYRVNLIRLLDQSMGKTSLIVDIDVYVMSSFESERIWDEHLEKMRYLKNKVFFGSIKKDVWEKLQ